MLSKNQQVGKRFFDIVCAIIGLVIFVVPITILILLATISTKQFGLFSQIRVGQYARKFNIYKIRTMRRHAGDDFISLSNDPRITVFGKFLRAAKLDEFPQIFNVLVGQMSLVGPRPDVPGYADVLAQEEAIILKVKPGITGPATLKYRNEEKILAAQNDPKTYNDEVIWRDKVKINMNYVKNWTFLGDLKYIYKTFFN